MGTLSPGLCVEFALDGFGYWGIFPSVTLDIPLTDSVGLDLIAFAWSDHDGGDLANAAYYGGGGLGVSYFLDDHLTASVSFNAFAGLNDAALGLVLAPGIAASYTF